MSDQVIDPGATPTTAPAPFELQEKADIESLLSRVDQLEKAYDDLNGRLGVVEAGPDGANANALLGLPATTAATAPAEVTPSSGPLPPKATSPEEEHLDDPFSEA